MVLWYFLQILSAGYEEVVEEAVVMDDTLNQSEQPDYTQVRHSLVHVCTVEPGLIRTQKYAENLCELSEHANYMSPFYITLLSILETCELTMVQIIQAVLYSEDKIIHTFYLMGTKIFCVFFV